jgi:hypothetical protein
VGDDVAPEVADENDANEDDVVAVPVPAAQMTESAPGDFFAPRPREDPVYTHGPEYYKQHHLNADLQLQYVSHIAGIAGPAAGFEIGNTVAGRSDKAAYDIIVASRAAAAAAAFDLHVVRKQNLVQNRPNLVQTDPT